MRVASAFLVATAAVSYNCAVAAPATPITGVTFERRGDGGHIQQSTVQFKDATLTLVRQQLAQNANHR